jgi:histidyl-tRNA synthetase
MGYAAPRGTADILPKDSPRWRHLESIFREKCRLYGYEELRTPTFEETDLFTRSIGEHTDIVSKEMYEFKDRGDRSITLRPEGTAPVVRAYLQHNLQAESPVRKLYYITSIFRYERPQAGRYREHHQVGVEAIGSADPAIDAEVISLGMDYLTSLGITKLDLKMNSVGCSACRPGYRESLKRFVEPFIGEMCESCQTRYEANPLRMLDCKVPQCRELTVHVPNIVDHLCDDCSAHLTSVLHYLDILGIEYHQDPRLVRGFDYYTKTAFEVQSGELGAQSAVLGGGRYDGLVEEMGGKATPAVGFGSGIERALAIMEAQKIEIPTDDHPTVFIVTLGDAPREAGVKIIADLRRAGIPADIDYAGKSMKAQMRSADREHAEFALIIGEDELAAGQVKLRNMHTKEEQDVATNVILKAVEGS